MMFGLQDKALAMLGGVLSIILGGALAFVWISAHFKIKSLESERDRIQLLLDDAKGDLVQCRANRITLEDATQKQNAAIDAEMQKGQRRIIDLERVANEAKAQAKTASDRAKAILAAKPKGDQCLDADALILGAVE